MSKGTLSGEDFTADQVKVIVFRDKIVGTGEWKDNKSDQCKQFKEAIDIGDVILVRDGATPIALVEVVEKNIESNIYDNEHKIKVLSLYNDNIKNIIGLYEGQAPGTLTIVSNKNNDTGKFIIRWHKLILKIQKMNSITDLLKYKKQIILQGPPGTGKTREAKELAFHVVFGKELGEDEITRKEGLRNLESCKQYKIIQFHPSYTYEDFVRGIVAKPNEEGNGLLYEAENKLLGEFALEAYKNYTDSNSLVLETPEEIFRKKLEIFLENVSVSIDESGEFVIGSDTTAKIVGIVNDGFIYSFEKRKDIKYKLLFTDLFKIHNSPTPIEKTIDVRDIAKGYLKMIGKHPYYFKVYKLIEAIKLVQNTKEESVLKNYVLIIDEINRANLPTVLGELIYALEYRGEKVESMYTVENESKLILPPNLYIIGTMNTADRSVGHIDYAIRRRFAFKDILPSPDPITLPIAREKFKEVSGLFISNYDDMDWSNPKPERSAYIASDFRPEDVWIGHSYFLTKANDENGLSEDEQLELKLRYEVIPILKEYMKDGVLLENEEVKQKINGLLS